MSKVYFSSYLKYYACWPELKTALVDLNIEYELLEGTNDIWVRDFMPLVSPEGRYITYTYAPDYLRDKPKYITDGSKLMPDSPLIPRDLGLVLDGGNIIWEGKQVICTDKIFEENGNVDEVIARMTKTLDYSHLTFLPWDKHEPFGHVDGMVRFVDEETVVMTNYCDFDVEFRQRLLSILGKKFTVRELHYDVDKPHKDNWAYINFLQVDDKFILPRLNAPEDEQALEQIAEIFGVPKNNIRMVDIHTILRMGGGLNCISWNAAPEMLPKRLISPNMENAFSEEVLKAVIENKIGYELRPDFWNAFNDSFSYFWNEEVGLGNDVYEGDMQASIFRQMMEKAFIVDCDFIDEICQIMQDFMMEIPGVFVE